MVDKQPPNQSISAIQNGKGMLQAVALSKGFASSKTRIQVLKNLTLKIEAQETLAIVGASGIGKSTLLHILGTLDRPDQGSLYFQGC